MSTSPLVELRAVEKRYGNGPAILHGIHLAIDRGDFVSFIGPSGCGKSTLLKLIAGLSPPTHGSIAIDGAPPERSSQELAYVFQEPTLLPWLTVEKNIEVPLTLRGVPPEKRRETCRRVLALVKLDDKARHFPRQLSGGQKMRVSLARALSLSPKLLLLDEPFGALDELTRDHLNEELLAIRQHEQWTAFFVTHSVSEAVFLSNRVVVLSPAPGRIHAELTIPLPYPRTVETRRSDEFFRLVSSVSRLLRSVETPAIAS